MDYCIDNEQEFLVRGETETWEMQNIIGVHFHSEGFNHPVLIPALGGEQNCFSRCCVSANYTTIIVHTYKCTYIYYTCYIK